MYISPFASYIICSNTTKINRDAYERFIISILNNFNEKETIDKLKSEIQPTYSSHKYISMIMSTISNIHETFDDVSYEVISLEDKEDKEDKEKIICFSYKEHKFSVRLGKYDHRSIDVIKMFYRHSVLMGHFMTYKTYKTYKTYNIRNFGGNSLAFCQNDFDKIIEKYDIQYEAFASVFNKYLNKYFSIFSEDVAFNSLGNFFDADPETFDAGIEVNPPFIESMLLKAVEKCHTILTCAKSKNKNIYIYFIGPKWTDSQYYNMLLKSPFIVSHTHQKKSFFDHYNDTTSHLTSTSSFFVLNSMTV